MPPRKRSKYGAVRTVYGGRAYASKREAAFAADLDLRMKVKGPLRVAAWTAQPRFPLVVNGVKVATLVADFLVTYGDGSRAVVDVKGMPTPVASLKKKLYDALYPEGPPLVWVK